MFIILFLSFFISLLVEELKFHDKNPSSFLTEQSIYRIIEIILICSFLFIFRNSPNIFKKSYQNNEVINNSSPISTNLSLTSFHEDS